MKKLQEDTLKQAIVASKLGWHLDRDLFWTRRRRKDDLPIPEGHASIGCDTERRIYVRSAYLAVMYDIGEAWR
jgi:hypothetical protein